MRKRVLIVESADAVRGVAESVLRQNGYEVIAVSTGEKAKEVLQYSRPDVIVLGADLKSADQTPFYNKLREDARTSSIPLVLFQPTEPMDLPFPPEVMVARPVDPRDFLQKVKTFSSFSEIKSPNASAGGPASIDDEFLDAALGLDQLDVTDSEVLGQTSTGIKLDSTTSISRSTQIGQDDGDQASHNESHRVETLMINEDQTDIMRRSGKIAATQNQKPPSGTSKLEIMSDQYGLTDPDAFKVQRQEQQHDYDWFVNSMREESASDKPAFPPSPAPATAGPDSHKLSFATTSSMLDPHTPGPASRVESKSVPESKSATGRGADVEKFIDEFKREIEVLKSTEPDSGLVGDTPTAATPKARDLAWEETLENVTPQQVAMFSRELARDLGERIAEKILSKIDSEKLLQLIKSEIVARQQRRRES
ncbi:hypothetical protein C3F09_05170 [candidate division GN15 bacterium]|uniref:Response regulatory domain-containing protein n=1 Tax=candidate division GN15 bacterium TaxID=2072418 RepID=A0A855X8F6_9BACT|nr:MAG: hypothetical protein C3F09_05170 [candidate division GN15 bacterium]